MYKVYWKLAVAAWFVVSTVGSSVAMVSPDPSAAPTDSSATPADLSAAPAVPSTAPADSSATPANLSAAPAVPSAAPTDSSATPANLSAAPAVPSAAPADSSTTPTDPDQLIAAIVRSIPHLLGEVIGHQQNAETMVKGIYVRLEDIASRQQGVESQLEDMASRQQGIESHLKDIISRLESVETWQNYTTETLASVAAETRLLVTPRDCSDLPPGSPSGVYQIRLTSAVGPAIDAFCNQTIAEGGWTVFQRRADIQPRQNFDLTWKYYKFGFGNMDEGEFWWGLEKLTRMTSSSDRKFQLRIDLEDEDGNSGYAIYDNFRISSEADGYRLHASNYTGDVGDSLTYSVGHKFTTKDRDQDGSSSDNCAHTYGGAWWHNSCAYSSLNARYDPGMSDNTVVFWHHWRARKCLKTVEMKLRPM